MSSLFLNNGYFKEYLADTSSTYNLLVDKSLSIASNTATVNTNDGNPISFKTDGSASSQVIKLNNGQYITNTVPLSGISSLKVSSPISIPPVSIK